MGAPFARRLKSYLWWGLWVGVAFFSVYPTLNGFTAARAASHRLYFDAELAIPLVPEFIWVYLSMYLLFLMPPLFLDVPRHAPLARRLIVGTLVAGVLYLLFPAELGFVREAPASPRYQAVFLAIFSIDHPHNLVPSLHVMYSATIAWALFCAGTSWKRGLWLGWLAALIASTLLVHQHHLLDVIGGLLLSYLLQRMIREDDRRIPAAAGAGA